MKLLLVIPLLLFGCITPSQEFKATSLKNDRMSCRIMCNKRVLLHNPITGECECYAPVKRKRSR